jgi:hypothetical protein
MWVHDVVTQKFLTVNDAAAELYGYSKEEFLTKRTTDIAADARAPRIEGDALGCGPYDVVGPQTNWTKQGQEIQVDFTSRPVEFSGRPARFVMIEAISDTAGAGHLLDRAHRLESIGELAGGIAHDFNNILGIISSYAEFVAEALAPESVGLRAADAGHWSDIRTDVGHIQKAVARGADLAHRLLAFAGQDAVNSRPLDVKVVVDNVTDLLRRSLGEHVDLVVSVDPGTWPVLFDPSMLEQVLLNLAVNARYAMKDGGTLTIDARNIPHPDANHRRVALQVSDTGVGMSAETLARAFEPFFTTKPRGEGTGLGLASAYGIVTGANGRIDISSEIGVGTTVTIALPPCADAAEPLDNEAEMQTHTAGQGELVLLVEDDQTLQKVVERMLTGSGYRVLVASSGAQALEVIRTHHGEEINVLLTDMVMPKMLGRELASRVRAEHPDIRVLFMSGYAPKPVGEANNVEPGTVLLRKPFGKHQLLEALGEVLAQSNAYTRSPPVRQVPPPHQERRASAEANRAHEALPRGLTACELWGSGRPSTSAG